MIIRQPFHYLTLRNLANYSNINRIFSVELQFSLDRTYKKMLLSTFSISISQFGHFIF